MKPVIRRALTCMMAAGLLHAAGLAQAAQYRVSGVVQDGANGYLQGARVFFDLNGNAAWDNGEPSNMTNAQGVFALQSIDPAAPTAAVVAEVPIITPKGKDTRSVAAPFTLAAPAGQATVINPLTTLVHGRMAATGASAADAAAHFAGLLGVPSILGYDYVAMNDSAAQTAAGSLATILANAQAEIADAVTDKIRLKMLIATADETSLALAAERSLGSIVITRGWIFAAVIAADAATNPRNVAVHPGEVVVRAGLGYHKTMFDSADNNCQNCHNDLYDTWKGSMHAKSWLDPIFQTKFQDFLRLQASKIGSTGPTGTLYTEQKFKGASQTCIRCHAPAAYYSNDFDVQLKVLSENPLDDYLNLKAAEEFNIAPAYNPNQVTKVVSLGANGKVYQASYHIGNKHNREGISCSVCHSIETVRLNNDTDGDMGQMKLATNQTAGPIGPVVNTAGTILNYSWDGSTLDMNNFFMITGPEKYADPGNTPKEAADYDVGKIADGRYTMKSIPLGEYTGGPFYGPWGVSGLENVRADDTLDRHALVNQHFLNSGGLTPGRDQHFKSQSKSLCLACHQRSAGALNPESNGLPGVQPDSDQFMELCNSWSVASTGPKANYKATPDSPQCRSCHMERLDNKVALHKWDAPDELYTAEDGMEGKWDPTNPDSLAARGYMASHGFVAGGVLAKLQGAIEGSVSAVADTGLIKVTTSLLNKTGHEFPAAHPMRRALARVVVTDATGKKIPYLDAVGASSHEDIVNTVSTLPGETVYPGRDQVGVKYNASRQINIMGMEADLAGEPVTSQKFDKTLVDWDGSYGTPMNPAPVQKPNGLWAVVGQVYTNKILASTDASNFTRIYGHETGKKDSAGNYLVLPGFDSSIARDNRLLTNERETYAINFDATQVVAWPVTVEYRVYYMKKGAGGAFPTAADGFLDNAVNASKKLGIKEAFRQSVTVDAP